MKLPYPKQVTITRILELVYGITLTREISAYYSLSRKEAKARGLKTTCLYLKDLYTQAQMMSLGLNPVPIPFRKCDKRGFAKDLRPFQSLLESDDLNKKRAGLTILRLGYLIFSESVKDTTSIVSNTNKNGIKSILRSFTAFARRRVPPADLGGSIEVIPRARSGPNGPSSLVSSHLDAVALSQRPSLLKALQELSDLIDPNSRGSPRNKYSEAPKSLTEWVEELTQWAITESVVQTDRRYPISRLAFLSEGGCKTRVIAVGDLFSQAVLLPIHDKLMSRLRKLNQDATFDQGKAISWLKEKTVLGGVYSFDLTTATDRFPATLQRIVLSAMFGKRFGSLWEQVMKTLRDFSFKTSRNTVTTDVYYTVGQGMGLYSSWPAFAYTHHIFVQWCAFKVGITPFDDYRIIGDDVVIANEAVAMKYRQMLDLLEVPISKSKSIVSIKPPFVGEIAKRLIYNGEDISPLPPELIKQVGKHVTMIPALIDEINSRYGVDYRLLSALPSLAQLYSRKADKEKAIILLSAPAAFLLGNAHPLYGDVNLKVVKVRPESIEPKDLGPWGTIDPEVLPDIGWIQDQVRKVFILREYETVFKQWNFFNPLPGNEVKLVEVSRASPDIGKIAINSQHPFWVASTWLECQLQDLFGLRIGCLGNEEDWTLEDIGVRYCLDPTMRSYRSKDQIRSSVATHLTLEVFKVLSGEKPMPQVEHPEDGLLVAHVRFTAG